MLRRSAFRKSGVSFEKTLRSFQRKDVQRGRKKCASRGLEMGLRPIPVGSCGFAVGEIPSVQPGKAEHMGLRPIPVGSCGFAAGEIPGVQPGKAEHMGLRPIPYFLLYQKEAKIISALRAVLSLCSKATPHNYTMIIRNRSTFSE